MTPSPESTTRPTGYYGQAVMATLGRMVSEKQLLREDLTPDAHGIILALVGLPARGKSFISHKVESFLKWKGLPTRMFNVGSYRRKVSAPEQSGKSDFFDSKNASAKAMRENVANAALEDVIKYLDSGGMFAIFDATNSTRDRRSLIREKLMAHSRNYQVIFIEVVCDDPGVLDINMRNKVRFSPDFSNLTEDEALEDLKLRIKKYEDVYETVHDDEGAFIKLFNLSSKVMAHHCYGRIAKSVMPFLMAIHVGTRPIWLVRACPGESSPCRLSKLSDDGRQQAQALAQFVRERSQMYYKSCGKTPSSKNLAQVYSSTMPRAVASVCYATLQCEQSSALNPIDKGAMGLGWWDVECDSNAPPWHQVERRHPEFWAQFRRNPLHCRFPGGESYMDVVRRLESVLLDIEMCTQPVLVVSHLTVLQLLLAYFRGVPIEEAWQIGVPKRAVIEVSPSLGGGFVVEEHALELQSGGEAAIAPDLAQDMDSGSEELLRFKRPMEAECSISETLMEGSAKRVKVS